MKIQYKYPAVMLLHCHLDGAADNCFGPCCAFADGTYNFNAALERYVV